MRFGAGAAQKAPFGRDIEPLGAKSRRAGLRYPPLSCHVINLPRWNILRRGSSTSPLHTGFLHHNTPPNRTNPLISAAAAAAASEHHGWCCSDPSRFPCWCGGIRQGASATGGRRHRDRCRGGSRGAPDAPPPASEGDFLGHRQLRESRRRLTAGAICEGQCSVALPVPRRSRRSWGRHLAQDDTVLLRESGQIINTLVGGDPGLAHVLRDLQIGVLE